RQVQLALLYRTAAAAQTNAGGRSCEHSRRLQRVRRADYIAELRGRSPGPEDRPARPVVPRSCGTGRPGRFLDRQGAHGTRTRFTNDMKAPRRLRLASDPALWPAELSRFPADRPIFSNGHSV